MNRERQIIIAAKVLSMIFNPYYLAVLGLLVLFLFSYLSLLPTTYKLSVLLMVYIFTVLLPSVTARLYRRHQGWISIACYSLCYYVMNMVHIPRFMGSIVMAALVIQVLCALINIWWKISTHTAAIGGVAGALVAFAQIFMFNPVWWLCLVIFIAGLVGTSRMLLRQHTLEQVVVGFWLGMIVAYITIII
ncbi:MAG: phosphatase PAP2 family protein [Prevotella sp.]|nr:phosphatase PAP2 family protein [Prevotella sp.]MBQ8702632.1 phosphatase PAP2 family protein [Prevotella sp.]MBQ8706102.1 phosphatase PAP2 family protein [Paludibacteraceae bacterium]MBQ9651083.1 phosphatase PAP2 family protein [Prevotella sp.]